ncbi:VOC family protein [Planococcus sp. N028]|uniref:VOC family protein n=1 Tax=Planococcus shixiaomingii TaxID=3058393 RepID=A0ABT8N1A3_9BACL|nr:VOC family protein [Planococcus sp. N028]MDN7241660.1 VOC family protein [Planococcus sp. N028]
MPVNPYLTFNGNCREAIEYYADVFRLPGPEPMTFGQVPPEEGSTIPPEMKDLVMHAHLNIHGTPVLFSDAFPQSPVVFGKNVTLAITSDDLDRLHKEFAALREGGRVIMDFQKTFFSPAYGVVEDKYGVEWQFNYDDGTIR